MDKGDFRVAQKNDLTYSVWQDTKPVLVLSNFHGPSQQKTVKRKGPDGVHHELVAPEMIAEGEYILPFTIF